MPERLSRRGSFDEGGGHVVVRVAVLESPAAVGARSASTICLAGPRRLSCMCRAAVAVGGRRLREDPPPRLRRDGAARVDASPTRSRPSRPTTSAARFQRTCRRSMVARRAENGELLAPEPRRAGDDAALAHDDEAAIGERPGRLGSVDSCYIFTPFCSASLVRRARSTTSVSGLFALAELAGRRVDEEDA